MKAELKCLYIVWIYLTSSALSLLNFRLRCPRAVITCAFGLSAGHSLQIGTAVKEVALEQPWIRVCLMHR